MDDEKRMPDVYAERITRVETRVEYITTEQIQLRGVLERQTQLLDGLIKQLNADELAAVAIRERTEQHAKTIEQLQSKEVDVTKILNKHDNDIESLKNMQNSVWGSIKYVIMTVGGLVIGYVFSHFVH